MVHAGHGLVPIEECMDPADERPRRRAKCPDRAANEVQGHGERVHVHEGIELADTVDLCGPLVDVVEHDEPRVEVCQDARARPAGVHRLERPPTNVPARAHADPLPEASDDRVDLPPGNPGDVAVRDGVGAIPIANQAPDRSDVLLTLDVGQDGIPTPEQLARKGQPIEAGTWWLALRRLDDTHRRHPSVRQVQEGRHGFARMPREFPLWLPVPDEDQHARPRPRLDCRVQQRPRLPHPSGDLTPGRGRVRIGNANKVAANRRGDDVLLDHQMSVVCLARLQQVPY